MMRKAIVFILLAVLSIGSAGCAALLVGVAAGGVGMYAASNDAIQGETDIAYDAIWAAAVSVSKIRGTVSKEDPAGGVIELDADSSKVWINVIHVTRATTRLRVASRKYKMPNVTLAQDIFMKIMEQAKQ